MADHPFIIPLAKIDVERRLVIGIAAAEIADKTKEIMDYESAKPAFQKWSNEFQDASGGLSKGNLRVMHTKTVAGKFEDIRFDDEKKQVHVIAKVVDDNEWQKCLSGCYTGFSIGGGYEKRWDDGDLKRYTPIIREISLVDNPCMPSARFAELVKADGIVGQIELRGIPTPTFAQAWAERPVAPATFAKSWQDRPQTFGEMHKSVAGVFNGLTSSEASLRAQASATRARKTAAGIYAKRRQKRAALAVPTPPTPGA